MELYIVRHAQSANNVLVDPRYRVCDPPLTELGKRQAELVAQHLSNGVNPELSAWTPAETGGNHDRHGYPITRLYCSPMARALQTARPIGQALDLAPEVWIDIHEQGGIFLDHGKAGGVVGYPGKTRSEILADFPHYVLPEGITERGWWQWGYEELSVCHGRAIKVAEDLGKWAASDERIAMVSHGGFIDALLKALFNQLPGYSLFYYHYNTAITRIDFLPGNRLDFRYLNRVTHLPPGLIS
jgi:broad specificity phosphatase PhoE